MDKAVKSLVTLDQPYKDGDVKKKRQIIGSIFPEKLVFDGINYRTARLNEAVKLIYTLDAGFPENKNGQTEMNFDLSTLVPRTGFFTVWFSISYK
ncbi:hypothetical protein [Chitinophaga sp. 212800010-3]|uniref:hypothetical protein n=1 Tax=unclassified Chitinophaga TaxID=2619133 RepID=UPI002DF572A5|nr:hypothetical protein [Chitinophaga sp. 212800010-3]